MGSKGHQAASGRRSLTPDLLQRPSGLGGQGAARQAACASGHARRGGCQHCGGHFGNAELRRVRCKAPDAAHNPSLVPAMCWQLGGPGWAALTLSMIMLAQAGTSPMHSAHARPAALAPRSFRLPEHYHTCAAQHALPSDLRQGKGCRDGGCRGPAATRRCCHGAADGSRHGSSAGAGTPQGGEGEGPPLPPPLPPPRAASARIPGLACSHVLGPQSPPPRSAPRSTTM